MDNRIYYFKKRQQEFMGISDLKKAIKPVGKLVGLESLRGKTVAIDTSCFLYRFLRSDICRRICPDAPLLYGFAKQIQLFREYQITPVYVFDGKPPEEKIVIEDRRKNDQKRKEDIQELTDKISEIKQYSTITEVIESIDTTTDSKITDTIVTTKEETVEELVFTLQLQKKKMELQSHRPNKENVGQCKEMFKVFGIPTIQAPAEADGMIAQLCIDGYVDAVVSTDTDQFAYGAPWILLVEKDITELTQFKIDDVYKHVGLSHVQFVDFCIMCGCDYLKRIKGIGVKYSLNYIQQHKTIEDVLGNLPEKFQTPEKYFDDVLIARTMFLCNPDGTVPNTVTKESLKWNYDKKSAKDWLSGNHPKVYDIFKNKLFPAGVQSSMKKFLIQPDND